jgi:hypothetical protein
MHSHLSEFILEFNDISRLAAKTYWISVFLEVSEKKCLVFRGWIESVSTKRHKLAYIIVERVEGSIIRPFFEIWEP